jgi:site-specific recombinase XerD
MKTQPWTLDRTKYLTPVQSKQLSGHCHDRAELAEVQDKKHGHVEWMVVHLGLGAGLRVFEIQDVRCSDCHVGYGESHLWVRNGKGGKAATVIIGKALKKHLRQYLKLKKAWGEDVSADAHLLVSERKQPFTRNGLQKKFKAVAKRAGLPSYFSIHCLRHTFGCELLRQTKNLRLVQKQMRHSSITTTTVYADVCDDEIQGAMDRME